MTGYEDRLAPRKHAGDVLDGHDPTVVRFARADAKRRNVTAAEHNFLYDANLAGGTVHDEPFSPDEQRLEHAVVLGRA